MGLGWSQELLSKVSFIMLGFGVLKQLTVVAETE